MRTRALIAAGPVLLALLAGSACNPGRPPAATVDGTEISTARLDEILSAYVEGAPEIYRSQIEGQGDDTFQMGAATAILNGLVLQVLQSELAEDAGVVPGEEDVTEAQGLVEAAFVSGAAQPDDTQPTEEASEALAQSTAIFEAMSESTQQWLVDLRAATIAYSDSLGASEEQTRAVYDQDPTAFDLLCLRAIIVDPADTAAVEQRLTAGEDFGAVSTDVTIDEQLAAGGGELGQCLSLDQLTQAGLDQEVTSLIAGLDVGDVAGPTDLGDGAAYYFELQERQQQAFEDVAEQIAETLSGDAALAQEVQDALAEVDVRVDPRFGTWDGETGTLAPPDGSRVPDALAVDGAVPIAGG